MAQYNSFITLQPQKGDLRILVTQGEETRTNIYSEYFNLITLARPSCWGWDVKINGCSELS